MKRIITKLGMVMAVLLSFLPASAYDFEADGIYYEVISVPDLTCKVTSGDVKYTGDIVIPDKVTFNGRELTVVAIGASAFYGTDITSVDIPETVSTIEYGAFRNCNCLINFDIPTTVTSIGRYMFSGCEQLISVSIPNTINIIPDGLFDYCGSLTSVILPNTITEIGADAFEYCTSLSSLLIPNSVKKIGSTAFAYCCSLTSMEIPESIEKMGNQIFFHCTSLKEVFIANGIEELHWNIFQSCEQLEYVNIPGSVNKIYGAIDNRTYNLRNISIDYSSEELSLYYDGYFRDDFDYYIDIPMESLYIDRKIDGEDLKYKTLKEITFGPHIETLQINPKKLENLESIISMAALPPTAPEFSHDQYMSIEVIVPEESLEAYQQAEGWKNFWNLQGDPNLSGVKEIGATPTELVETGRYNLNGQKVSEDYDGIVIVRYSDGSTRKMIQK